jgi:hypothetical protein
VGRTVWVVLNTLNLAGDAVFHATEIDHTVVVLVTAAFVTGCDVPVVVTTRFLVLGFQQRGVRLTFVQVVTGNFDNAALTGRCRFHLDDCHD